MGLAEKDPTRANERVRLSEGEKLIVLLLSEIQGQYEPQDSSRAKLLHKAISSGNLWSVEEQFPEVFDNIEISKATANEIRGILGMWQQLEESFSRLSPSDKESLGSIGPQGKHVKFIGFSENYEVEQIGATNFLVNVTEQFEYFKGRELNSHLPMLGQYHRMLARFHPILAEVGNGDLSARQLADVLSA